MISAANYIPPEPTRLIRYRTRMPEDVRLRNGTIYWGAERVRELIDGDGPAPRGLDSEAIAAARRIARRLSTCRCS